MSWGEMIMTASTLAMFLLFLYTVALSVTKLQQGDIATTVGSNLSNFNYPSMTICNVVDMPGSNATIDDVTRAVPDRSTFIPSIYFIT
jgi:hypothetical protein